jgi:hypothetical protein
VTELYTPGSTLRPKSGPYGAFSGLPAVLGPADQEKALVIACALSWVGTPYADCAAVKGEAVDCAYLLLEVYVEAGLIERFDPGPYAPDWMMHRDEERYLQTVQRFAKRELEAGDVPGPADVVVWKFGRCYSHGAIVTAWPYAVHAYSKSSIVEESNVAVETDLQFMRDGKPRPRRAFSLWDA